MKVLISIVGRRDPFAEDGSEGAILTVARHVTPDRVWLFPTHGLTTETSSEAEAESTKTELEKIIAGVQVHLRPLALEDLTDYSELTQRLPGAVHDALFGLTPEDEVHCSVSSGPSQPRAVLTTLLIERGGDVRFWEARAPQFVTASQPRVRELDLAMLRRPATVGKLAQAWQVLDFAGVSLLLRERIDQQPLASTVPLLAWAADLADAYARWDAVDWHDALSRLEAVYAGADPRSSVAPMRPLIERQLSVLRRLASATTEDYWTMLDLYHNATRRLRARLYVDALARWRRVLEGSLYATVRAIPGCAIDAKGVMTLDDNLHTRWAAWRKKRFREDTPPERPRASVPDLLYVCQDSGRLSPKFANAVEGFTEARNKSIVAHGLAPVEEPTASQALKQLHGLLGELFKQDAALQPIDSYPFGLATLDDAGARLSAIVTHPA